MNRDEAFALWYARLHLDGDPVTPAQAFDAGWDAHIEALKQQHMPFGADGTDLAPTPEQIWSLWPVKKARGAALPAIAKAVKKAGGAAILQAVKDYAKALETWPAQDRQYIPMCSTWMNQERYLDDRKEWVRGAAAAPSQFSRS